MKKFTLVAMLALAVLVIVVSPTQYQFDVTLLRLDADNSRSVLEDGSAVAVGDDLVLELSATAPLYVYVFNEDDLGINGVTDVFVRDNTTGDVTAVSVDSAGIVERFPILASHHFDERVAEQFAALPPARLPDPGFAPRGIGRVSRRDDSPAVSATAMIQLSRELADTGETNSGVSYRVIELHNPDCGDLPKRRSNRLRSVRSGAGRRTD